MERVCALHCTGQKLLAGGLVAASQWHQQPHLSGLNHGGLDALANGHVVRGPCARGLLQQTLGLLLVARQAARQGQPQPGQRRQQRARVGRGVERARLLHGQITGHHMGQPLARVGLLGGTIRDLVQASQVCCGGGVVLELAASQGEAGQHRRQLV